MARRRNVTRKIDYRFTCFRLRIGRSRIHNLGVFACEPIPPGRKVIEYTGERISPRENRRRYLAARKLKGTKAIYLARLNRYWTLDGAVGGSGAEYVNHRCDPNLVPRRFKGHLLMMSLRRIRAGEELTADYRFPKNAELVPCYCGSPRCRGTINVG